MRETIARQFDFESLEDKGSHFSRGSTGGIDHEVKILQITAVGAVFIQKTAVFALFTRRDFGYGFVFIGVLFAIPALVAQNTVDGYADVSMQVDLKGFGQEEPGHAAVHHIRAIVFAQVDKNAVNFLIDGGVGIGAAIHFEGVDAHFGSQLALDLASGNILKAGEFAEDSGYRAFSAAQVARDRNFSSGREGHVACLC